MSIPPAAGVPTFPTGSGLRRGIDLQAGEVGALLLVAGLPFAYLYEGGFIGQLFGTELLFLLLLPYLLFLTASKVNLPVRSLLRWLGILIVTLIATDIYRDSFIGDYLRGWAKVLFFAMDLYVLAKLLTTERRIYVWCVSWNIAYAISVWKEFDDFATRWKYGLALCAVTATVAAIFAVWPRRYRIVAPLAGIACLGLATASLFLNARSTFLGLGLSGLLILIASIPPVQRNFGRLWDRHPYALIFLAVLVPYLSGLIYVEGASSGIFGDDARLKLAAQSSDAADPVLAILAGGRTEFYSSTAAISDSPIIGYGSWARSAYYYNIYSEQLHAHGTPEQINEIDSHVFIGEPLIPTHSHLLGAWVEEGIVGALFWLFVLRMALRSMRRAIDLTSGVQVLVLVLSASFLWNLFFSPFGGEMRLVEALTIVVLLFNLQSANAPASRS